jgi:predicted enzyme related to lactoylglutathione lyase
MILWPKTFWISAISWAYKTKKETNRIYPRYIRYTKNPPPGLITLEIERQRTMNLLVNIEVDDLETGITFYQNALGLRLGRRLFDNTVAEMAGASSNIYLLTKPSGTAASPQVSLARDYRRHWTPVHLDFEVDDVEAAVQRALAAGAKLESDIQTFAWGRIAMMSDPFGHGFCLLQFIGRGYDEVA